MGLIKPSTKAYLATAGCLILIILNVGLFVFLPKSAAPLWVVISNVITVLIMLLAVKPIMTLQDKEIDEKALAKAREEEALRGKIASLESENRELASRLDTYSQSAGVPSSVNFTFKLETMTYDKSGYIVKEEPLEKFLEDPAYKLADTSLPRVSPQSDFSMMTITSPALPLTLGSRPLVLLQPARVRTAASTRSSFLLVFISF